MAASSYRAIQVSHKGHLPQTFLLYSGIPPPELCELLATVFSFSTKNVSVVGLKAKEGHGEPAVIPISLACLAPEHLNAAEYELVVTGGSEPPTPDWASHDIAPLKPPSFPLLPSDSLLDEYSMRTVVPEEETRCTETDAEDDNHSASSSDGDLMLEFVSKLTEAGALDPKEADVITGMIADRDSLLLRALNLLWPDEDMDDQRIEEAQMAMLQRFLVQAARHQATAVGRMLYASQEELFDIVETLTDNNNISPNQAMVLKTRVLMEDPEILTPFQEAKAAQTRGGVQKEPPLLELMGTLVSLAKEEEEEDLEEFLPPEEQGHHECTCCEAEEGEQEADAIDLLDVVVVSSAIDELATTDPSLTPADIGLLRSLLDDNDRCIARAYDLYVHSADDDDKKDRDMLSLLNALRAIAMEARPPGRRSTVESQVHDAAARRRSLQEASGGGCEVPEGLVTLLHEAVEHRLLPARYALMAVQSWARGQASSLRAAWETYSEGEDVNRLLQMVQQMVPGEESAESGDEAGGTEAEPTTEDRSEKSVEDAEDEMCTQREHNLRICLDMLEASGALTEEKRQSFIDQHYRRNVNRKLLRSFHSYEQDQNFEALLASVAALAHEDDALAISEVHRSVNTPPVPSPAVVSRATATTPVFAADDHTAEKALKELIDFLYTANRLSKAQMVCLRRLVANWDNRLLQSYASFQGRGAEGLSALVNDLLQVAEEEAGNGLAESEEGIELAAFNGERDRRRDREEQGMEMVTIGDSFKKIGSPERTAATRPKAVASTSLRQSNRSTALNEWSRHRLEVLDRLIQLAILPRVVYDVTRMKLESDADAHSTEFKWDPSVLIASLKGLVSEILASQSISPLENGGDQSRQFPVWSFATTTTGDQAEDPGRWTNTRLNLLRRITQLGLLPKNVEETISRMILSRDPNWHDLFSDFDNKDADLIGLVRRLQDVIAALAGTKSSEFPLSSTPPPPPPPPREIVKENPEDLSLKILLGLNLTATQLRVLREALSQKDSGIQQAIQEFHGTHDTEKFKSQLARIISTATSSSMVSTC